MPNQTSNLFQFKINLSFFMCVLFYLSFVCISAYANVYFKTTIIKQNIKIILIAGVPSSQALPGFRITAPPSACVPAVLVTLAVWIQNHNKNKNKRRELLSIMGAVICLLRGCRGQSPNVHCHKSISTHNRDVQFIQLSVFISLLHQSCHTCE